MPSGFTSTTDRQAHWEHVYTTKGEAEVTWFQETPAPSLELIALVGATRQSAIIDIGGGASRLVDRLVSEGYSDLTVLDLSERRSNAHRPPSAASPLARRRRDDIGAVADV